MLTLLFGSSSSFSSAGGIFQAILEFPPGTKYLVVLECILGSFLRCADSLTHIQLLSNGVFPSLYRLPHDAPNPHIPIRILAPQWYVFKFEV